MNLLFRLGSYLPQMSEYAFKNISESQFPKMIYLYGVWCSEYFCISFLECHFNCVFMMRCRESKIVSSTFFSKCYQPFLDISTRRWEDSIFLLICAHLYVTLFKFSRFFTSVFFFYLNLFHGHTLNDFVFHPAFNLCLLKTVLFIFCHLSDHKEMLYECSKVKDWWVFSLSSQR